MGTATRFFSFVGGLLLIGIALFYFGIPIYQTIVEPEYADFPGGAAGLVVMLLVVAAFPFGGGLMLMRRALRAAPADAAVFDQPSGVAPTLSTALSASRPPLTAQPIEDAAPAMPAAVARPIEMAAPAASPAAARASAPRKRLWLSAIGLGISVVSALMIVVSVAAILNQGADPGLALFIILSGLALWAGVRVARAGDPDIGRRFLADLGGGLPMTRQLARLARSSAGLGLAAALVGIPLMIIFRRQAHVIGLIAMTVYSVTDPAMNVTRRSWWHGAYVSGTVWFVLFLVLAATTQFVTGSRDIVIVYMLPMAAYPVAMAVSGVVRLLIGTR